MWQRVAASAWRAGAVALDLLLPPQCLTCDQPVDAPGRFCAGCFRATTFVTEPCCRRCGVPFAHLGEAGPDRICPGCHAHPPPWHRARAALRYDAQARRILLPFKHGDRIELASALAVLMQRAGAILLDDADLLVPVPLHRRRLVARRYNQAALLAGALARLSGKPSVPDALVRLRATMALNSLSAASRIGVLDGAFAVRPQRRSWVEGQRILLVDDVLTSGATSGACARALLAAGAEQVDVLVAARVPDPRLRQ
jgi:ComF family protein